MGGSIPPHTTMKSIYERLNPDILASINKDKQKYPYTTKALKEKLKKSISWDQLTIGDIRTVILHSHVDILNISHSDLIWGDKFLVKDDDDEYIVSITG